ncbi:MAG: hypothetical protein M0R77_08065 [Gammaproteobacteria bacterium]|nr:hypothetical protein [Gammaproteobacteria bacterium]
MSQDVREYSPSEVVMTFGGAIVEGWERLSIRRMHPSFRIVEGIRGKNTRVRIGNSAAEIDITLSQTSPTNLIFSQIVTLDEAYGTGRIEITLKDVLTGEVFQSTEAFLERPADKEFEAESSERVWKMYCLSSDMTMGSGGNWGSLVDRITSLF